MENMKLYDRTSEASLTLSFEATTSLSTSRTDSTIESTSNDFLPTLYSCNPSLVSSHSANSHRYSNNENKNYKNKNKKLNSNKNMNDHNYDNDSNESNDNITSNKNYNGNNKSDDSDDSDNESYIAPLTSNKNKVMSQTTENNFKNEKRGKGVQVCEGQNISQAPTVSKVKSSEERWYDMQEEEEGSEKDIEDNNKIIKECRYGNVRMRKEKGEMKGTGTGTGTGNRDGGSNNDEDEDEDNNNNIYMENNVDENLSDGSGPIRFQLTSRILDSTATRAVMKINFDSTFDSSLDVRTDRGSRTQNSSISNVRDQNNKGPLESNNCVAAEDLKGDDNYSSNQNNDNNKNNTYNDDDDDSDNDDDSDSGHRNRNKVNRSGNGKYLNSESSNQNNPLTYRSTSTAGSRLISGSTINNRSNGAGYERNKFQSTLQKRELMLKEGKSTSVFSNSTSFSSSSSLLSVKNDLSNSTFSTRSFSSTTPSSSFSSNTAFSADDLSDKSSHSSKSEEIEKKIERTLKKVRQTTKRRKNEKLVIEEDDICEKGMGSEFSASSDSESRIEVQRRGNDKIAFIRKKENDDNNNNNDNDNNNNDNDNNDDDVNDGSKKNERNNKNKKNKKVEKRRKNNLSLSHSDYDSDSDCVGSSMIAGEGVIRDNSASTQSPTRHPLRLWRPN